MLDYIVLTFVFVNQAGREREAGAKSTVPWVIARTRECTTCGIIV